MIDFTRDWIASREQLEQAAAPGPWRWEPPSGDDWPSCDESLVTEDGDAVLLGWGYDASGIEGDPADRAFIADARTSLPAALAALKAVLEGHRPVSFSFSWRDGVTMHEVCPGCQDKAGVHPCGCWRDEDTPHLCAVCSDLEHRMDVPYPCMTVRAIEAALRGES